MILAWPCFACQSFEGSRAVLYLEAEVLEITEPGRAENEKQLAQKTVQRAGKATWMLCRELNSLHSIQAVAHWVVGGRYPMPFQCHQAPQGLPFSQSIMLWRRTVFQETRLFLPPYFPAAPDDPRGRGVPQRHYFQNISRGLANLKGSKTVGQDGLS